MKHLLLFISIIITLDSQRYDAIAAATAPLPRTGQAYCYDTSGANIPCNGTGQDGEYMMGVAWPNPRFVVNTEPTVTDNLTGLVWSKDANMMATRDPWYDTDCIELDGRVPWHRALGYIGQLNSLNWLGHNDWRLPNKNELDSLINIHQTKPSTWLNSQGFTNVQELMYWSSSNSAFNAYSAWAVSISDGFVYEDAKQFYCNYVWPVRSDQPESFASVTLPQTGQTTCYDSNAAIINCDGTRQDGDSQAGALIPSPRFTDNTIDIPTNKTVTDNLTGLVWSRDANVIMERDPSFDVDGTAQDGRVTWQHALDYIKKLNTENYLGHNDWRMPNRTELMSLINISQPTPSTWLNTQMFINVQLDSYWSSSPYADHRNWIAAWYVDMNNGHSYFDIVSKNNYVWPVREGDSGSLALSVSKSGSGTGNVTSSAANINCGSTCRAYYPSGISVALTATPDDGSVFMSWSGCNSISNSICNVTMNDSKKVTANFQTAPQYLLTLTFEGTGGGSVNGSMSCVKGGNCPPQSFEDSISVTLTPSADSNSIFTSWNPICTVSGTNCMVTMNSDKNITATFTEADKVRIGTTPFQTLTAAFSNAASGMIMARAIEFAETFSVALPTVFKGGWNATFGSNTGNFTVLNGSLTIGTGNLVVEGLSIR